MTAANGASITKDTKLSLGAIGILGALLTGVTGASFVRLGSVETSFTTSINALSDKFETKLEALSNNVKDIRIDLRTGADRLQSALDSITTLKTDTVKSLTLLRERVESQRRDLADLKARVKDLEARIK